jgi:ubiquinone/menaquinone biosynthesis C-methylase UbiE
MKMANRRTLLRMNIARAPEKEGEQDSEAVLAYDHTCGWLPFRVLRHMVLRRLERCRPQGTLLDAGCGPGHLAIAIGGRFPGLKVTGLDNNADMIAAARRNRLHSSVRNVDFQPGDVHRLPGEDGSIDFVVSTLSLHHWQDARRAFGEIHRVLKPGGRLLLMDLRRDCARWFFYGIALMQWAAVPAAIRRTNGAVGSVYSSYTVGEIAEMLRAVPFQHIDIEPAPGWMFALAQKAGGAPTPNSRPPS